jgi:alkylhydroperoxidase family enzyme
MDIGSAVGRQKGVTEEQLVALGDHANAQVFSPAEKVALRLADAMAATPAVVPDDLFRELRGHFDEPQLVELAAAIAWEHYRSRFNKVFDIESDEFSEGAVCVIPARMPKLMAPE